MHREISLKSSFYSYVQLMKPGVMSLVVFSAFIGMILAPGHLYFSQGLAYIVCIAMASGAAAAINMGYDYDIDATMKRTQKRPTVLGIIRPKDAITFGAVLGSLSVLILAIVANFYAAFYLGFTIIFYSYIYTVFLKRNTDQNIVIGGLSGALPPFIGWICVDTSFHILPWILVLIIFLWTPPHFWSLSLYAHKDYLQANIPMLVVTQGHKITRLWILVYAAILIIPVTLPYIWGYMGLLYIIPALVIQGLFVFFCAQLYFNPSDERARHTFLFSILYLFALFLFMWADHLFS